jgi:hypothetical protein
MRSVGAGAECFRGVGAGCAPHNREGCGASLWRQGAAVGQRDQMSLCSPFSPWTRVA